MSNTVNNAPSNTLSLLLGDYNSDTDNEDTASTTKNPEIAAKVDEFFSELLTENQTTATNWTECIDKTTGHPYYYNIETKEVTWELPAEYADFLAKHQTLNSNTNKWTKYYTDGGIPYFVNDQTRKVLWEQPTDYVESRSNSTQSKMKKKSKKDKKSKHHTKLNDKSEPKKKYPFDENFVDEKIELITSFEDKSDTSSSDDDKKGKRSKTKSANKLMIVAEYHSENEHSNGEEEDEETSQRKSEKPLFAAAHTPNQPILPIQINADATNTTSESVSSPEIETSELEKIQKPKANSFASIITGGRSPDGENQNIIELTTNENQQIQNAIEPNSPMEMDKKLFQRKRRIEFITKTTPILSSAPATPSTQSLSAAQGAIYPQPLEELIDETEQPQNPIQKAIDDNTATDLNGITSYPQFHKSHVEFSGNDNEATNKQDKSPVDESDTKQKEEIGEIRNVIEAKIKFLCDGRPEVSAVQAIMIQMETLLEAYDEQALQSTYIKKWLDGISSDLIALERDAAPAGWKCLWNRKKSRYYYKNISTGNIQWDYPELDVKIGDGDEMDICTTPPPNDEPENCHEPDMKKLKKDLAENKKDDDGLLWAPPPPIISKISTQLEPLPPGIDHFEYDITNRKSTNSEALNSELASFYSDLATIDPIPVTANSVTSPIDADPPGNDQINLNGNTTVPSKQDAQPAAASVVLKKKKKKTKKIEPWKSGSIETWINQWQKAQKEL